MGFTHGFTQNMVKNHQSPRLPKARHLDPKVAQFCTFQAQAADRAVDAQGIRQDLLRQILCVSGSDLWCFKGFKHQALRYFKMLQTSTKSFFFGSLSHQQIGLYDASTDEDLVQQGCATNQFLLEASGRAPEKWESRDHLAAMSNHQPNIWLMITNRTNGNTTKDTKVWL